MVLPHLRFAAFIVCSTISVMSSRPASAQCSGGPVETATIELISPPFSQLSTQLRLSEFYLSGVDIGTVQAVVTGNQIDLTQTNLISLSPTLTCRVQVIDLGSFSPGNYNVTWRTTEHRLSLPTPQIRIRILSFEILPAAAVPTVNRLRSSSDRVRRFRVGILRLRE